MRLLLMPPFADTAKDLGFQDLGDVDEDAVLHQQGYDMDIVEVEPGEEFEVPKNSDFGDAQVDGENVLKLIGKNFMDEDEIILEDSEIRLTPGKYRFDEDGESIYLIEDYDELYE